jgi:hypothetical protein
MAYNFTGIGRIAQHAMAPMRAQDAAAKRELIGVARLAGAAVPTGEGTHSSAGVLIQLCLLAFVQHVVGWAAFGRGGTLGCLPVRAATEASYSRYFSLLA